MEGEKKMEGMDVLRTAGFGWRVSLSIGVFFGWLVFLIIWLFFYADDYDVFQNIAVFLVSVLVGIGILAAMWAPWGIRYAGQMGKAAECKKSPGWASVLSAIAGIGWLVFLIVWLFFYAGDFSGYQNLAIVIVSILVLAGITGATWAYWGTRFGH